MGYYVFIAGLGLLLLLIYYLFPSKKAVIHTTISKAEKTSIGAAKDGEVVRIKGQVVLAGRTLVAPLSKRRCVYYHVRVKDSSSRRELFKNYIDLEEEKMSDVVIYDGEHYAVINTKLVALFVEMDEESHSCFWHFTTPELKEFLVKHGERPTDYMGWSLDLTASEGALEEGETLTIAGKANWRPASQFRFKLPVDTVLYLEPLNEHGVYLTDSPL